MPICFSTMEIKEEYGCDFIGMPGRSGQVQKMIIKMYHMKQILFSMEKESTKKASGSVFELLP